MNFKVSNAILKIAQLLFLHSLLIPSHHYFFLLLAFLIFDPIPPRLACPSIQMAFLAHFCKINKNVAEIALFLLFGSPSSPSIQSIPILYLYIAFLSIFPIFLFKTTKFCLFFFPIKRILVSLE